MNIVRNGEENKRGRGSKHMDYTPRLEAARKVIEAECLNKANIEVGRYFKRLAPMYEECIKLGDNSKEYHYVEYLKTILEISLSKLIGSKDVKELEKKAENEKKLAGII